MKLRSSAIHATTQNRAVTASLAQHHEGALLYREVPKLRAYATLGVAMSRVPGPVGIEE